MLKILLVITWGKVQVFYTVAPQSHKQSYLLIIISFRSENYFSTDWFLCNNILTHLSINITYLSDV